MKIAIVGGHLAPALAIIKKLNKSDEIFYIGRKHSFEGDKALSLEFQEISSLNIPFYPIKTGRLQRKLTKHSLPSLLRTPQGFYGSYKILKKINPDVVLAFGGYISVPVVIAASFLKIPTVIHEQTFGAGMANKVLSKFATKILISWESSKKHFPAEKTILTGNPIKEEITKVKDLGTEKNLIYVTGGSAGSHFINSLIERNLDEILQNFTLIHQTGDSEKYNDFQRLTKLKNNLPKNIKERYVLSKFYDSKETAENLQRASMVIGRSGINTVSELIFLQKPAILIPLPFAQKNEQLVNALFLKECGLGEYLIQNEITDKIFIEKIKTMMKNIENYKLKDKIIFENAEDKIIKILTDVSQKKTS